MGELYHHGIQGQRWGIRRYQNEDGSLTSLGREHYDVGEEQNNLSKIYGGHSDRWSTQDYVIPKGTTVQRNSQSNSESTDKLIDDKRPYSYVYDESNDRDKNFYSQFGKKVTSYEFEKEAKVAGMSSIAKALEEEYFDKPIDDIDETEFQALNIRLRKYSNKEVSATYAPYDPKKSPEENKKHYEDIFTKAAAQTVGTAASQKRDDEWDKEEREYGSRHLPTATNDIAVKVINNLSQKGYSAIRDYTDLGGNAGVVTPTIIYDENATKKRKEIIK